MRTLKIKKQVRLGFARVVELCLYGVYYRLFRALVTLSIVTVAVAFMMYMLAGSLIARGVWRQAQAEAEACKVYDRWAAWFEESMDKAALFSLAATCAPNDPRLRGIGRWAGVDAAGLRDMQALACDSRKILVAVDTLTPGRRLRLIGGLGDGFLLDVLQDAATCERFLSLAATIVRFRLPGGPAGLRNVLERYQTQRAAWERAVAGRGAALRALRRRLPEGAHIGSQLAAPASDLAATLAELGLLDDPAILQVLRGDAQYQVSIAHLAGLMKNPVLRRDVAARAGVGNLDVTFEHLAHVYLKRGGPAFVDGCLRRVSVSETLDHAATSRLLAEHVRRLRVLNIEAESAGSDEGALGFSQTTWWLLGVSVIVCVVGITNAMLMSVMERFREIATMKCLGARDSFVMALFVMESCMQGVAGGLMGALLGLLMALPVAWLKFGAWLWSTVPWGALGAAALIAMGLGVLLAGLASLYPARIAARLAPMEAMKVE